MGTFVNVFLTGIPIIICLKISEQDFSTLYIIMSTSLFQVFTTEKSTFRCFFIQQTFFDAAILDYFSLPDVKTDDFPLDFRITSDILPHMMTEDVDFLSWRLFRHFNHRGEDDGAVSY